MLRQRKRTITQDNAFNKNNTHDTEVTWPTGKTSADRVLDYHFGEVQQDQVDGVAYETEELANLMPDDIVIEATEGAQVA